MLVKTGGISNKGMYPGKTMWVATKGVDGKKDYINVGYFMENWPGKSHVNDQGGFPPWSEMNFNLHFNQVMCYLTNKAASPDDGI